MAHFIASTRFVHSAVGIIKSAVLPKSGNDWGSYLLRVTGYLLKVGQIKN